MLTTNDIQAIFNTAVQKTREQAKSADQVNGSSIAANLFGLLGAKQKGFFLDRTPKELAESFTDMVKTVVPCEDKDISKGLTMAKNKIRDGIFRKHWKEHCDSLGCSISASERLAIVTAIEKCESDNWAGLTYKPAQNKPAKFVVERLVSARKGKELTEDDADGLCELIRSNIAEHVNLRSVRHGSSVDDSIFDEY